MLSQPSYLPNVDDDLNKFNFFLQYIEVPFVEVIVDRTNQTAVSATGHSLNLGVKEFYTYIGVTFVMMIMYFDRYFTTVKLARELKKEVSDVPAPYKRTGFQLAHALF